MPSNRGVVYVEPGKVEVQSIAYPKLKMPASETHPFGGKDAPHGVILKLVTTTFETQTTLDVNGVKLEPGFSDLCVRLVFMRLSRPPPVKVL